MKNLWVRCFGVTWIQDLSGSWRIKGADESSLWGDLDQRQLSKICLDHVSKEPMNPLFGVIWIRVSDPRSVWIMVYQRKQ